MSAPARASQLSPQELAEACARAMWATDHASQGLAMSLDRIAPGEASLSMTLTREMSNGHGMCHGGYIFTLADSAFAFACNSFNQKAVAQHCSVTYLNPGQIGDRLTATARVVARQGRSGIYDITIVNQTGVTVAEFRGHSRTVAGTHVPD
ncbi:MAG: hydroxyphenylacetyl-CoA thioesterase PaaI [Roseibium sp.]|nr:hydroxyphenylacetyl-CoA thioesterase PaaI [Roseibium sp.]